VHRDTVAGVRSATTNPRNLLQPQTIAVPARRRTAGVGIALDTRTSVWRWHVTESVVVVFFWVVLAATAATAQHNGKVVTQTVANLTEHQPNGAQRVGQQVITRSSRIPHGEEVVTEIYLPGLEGGRLALSSRVRRVTTTSSDKSETTVEETEARSSASPGDPMRLIKRSITTVRTDASGAKVTEQQVFELDVNGRLVPVLTQIEQKSPR
jgi:hypothetical protein